MVNISVSLLYVVTIIGGAIGETWAYYLIGSVVEVILLAAIARTAWSWPPPERGSLVATTEVGEPRPHGQGLRRP